MRAREREMSITIDTTTTTNAHTVASTWTTLKTSRSIPSEMIHPQVTNSSSVSSRADRFSTFPCPYRCSASAGLSEYRTAKYVTTAATRSSPECAASASSPKLSVVRPTSSLPPVSTTAAPTDVSATHRFSRPAMESV
jgi:hypothetical protein